ncbi:hypothetical protein ACEPAG_4038 [Sanghuangporus baumii]
MSSIADNFDLNNSVAAIADKATSRPRSATISVPATYISKSNVHVSVSVSLSESLASISAWASQIVPGAPPTSPSPRRSSFYSLSPKTPVRSPKSSHRRSLSATFFNFRDSPSAQPQTPAPKAVSPADLLAHGYTSIFVHLPSRHRGSDYAESIPESFSPPDDKFTKAPPFLPRAQPRSCTKSVSKEKGEDKLTASFNRLRSFSFKAKKTKTSDAMGFTMPPVPPLPSRKPSARPNSPRSKSSHPRKPKSTPQARYAAILGPGGGTGALPLSQEVALAQMLDGGSLDANVRRVTERHARAAGTHTKPSSVRDEVYKKERKDRRPIEKREGIEHGGKVGAGVSGIYRDPEGNLWWDEDESLEFAGLLPSSEALHLSHSGQMPLSNSHVHNQDKEKRRGLLPRLMTTAKPPPTTALPAPPNWVPLHSPVATSKTGRKGSASDASSPETDGEDPDLDPAYAVRPRESSSLFAAGYSISAEKERHLRRAPRGIEAFGVSPLDTSSNSTANSVSRERRERKRPAPLTLPLPAPTPHVPTTGSTLTAKTTSRPPTAMTPPPPLPSLSVLHGPTREEHEGRQEFFASAFAPRSDVTTRQPVSAAIPASSPMQQNSQATASTKMSRRGSLTVGFSSLGLGLGGKAGRRASYQASPTSPVSRAQAQAQVQTYPSPYSNGPARGGNNVHHGLSKTSSRPSIASGTGPERSLKPKASRSRLAGLFKRN